MVIASYLYLHTSILRHYDIAGKLGGTWLGYLPFARKPLVPKTLPRTVVAYYHLANTSQTANCATPANRQPTPIEAHFDGHYLE